ncbi:hypothetical protein VitviT2T_020315 [Vitis vinifera]|uniref:Disease resistance RPP13-like protein 1 n=1 Tax=Vitis vinifera TaxID=29760 RepID=A0ABY9D570_VITVI|nr:hypothetical protein VitviT2T_020315 [Vitis vinifera]
MAGFVGEAILSGFIQKLVDMVTSPELWKYARKEQVDSELKRWKNILIKIYVVLNDAEEKQMTNPLVKIWLDELRDLAYDVEDILDDFATEALRSSLIMAQPQQGTSKVRGMLSSLIPSASTSNSSMRSKIEEITARLKDISAQKNDLDLREIEGGWSDRKRKRAQILPTTSLVVESDVYGRETDKAAIVDMLLKHDPSSDDEVSVIPIVGMGGIGKTTLAQLVFNDDEVKGRFDLRAWVCVSDYFDVLRITKIILQSVDSDTRDVNDLNLLQVKLKEKFSGKKFLLVLDDVWNENCHEWDTLCMPMRAGAAGSKLIVTTRNEGVAAVTRTCPAYPLGELSNNDCLSLFTQQALRTRNFDAHPHLKEVGEEIVRRCKGLPLAAKALGGMLRNQLSRDAWANILTSRIWDLPEDKSPILPALMISYHHLPSHLKWCFAYCSMFPKDYEFNKDDLVLLWMAEGFLQKTKEAARPEDLGSKYFDDLFSRSFFQHSVMRWSDWLVLLEEQRLPCNLKMLSIQGDANLEKLLNGLQTLTCLKQLEIRGCPKLESFPERGLPPMLRSLKVIGCQNLKRLPHNYNSCALEFLDITSCPSLRCFPNCELPTTLKSIWIEDCKNLESLPEGMMHHDSTCCLEELKIKGCSRLESFPDTGLPPLLRRLVVSDCKGLKLLPHNYSSCALESLEIRYCPSLRCFPNGELPTTLKSIWIEDCRNLESLPEGMMHHNSTCCLEELKIKGCPRLESFPDTGLPPLLRRLVVSDCKGLKLLPHNYSSCALESLEIRYCPSLRCFPNGELPTTLKSVWIEDCKNLESLPKGMMHHNSTCCLEILTIRKCSSLKSFSTRELPSTLKKLEIYWCPELESMSENMCPNNSALDNLVLEGYPNLKILPECLPSLKSLRIINCEGLECFPARGLSTPTLTELYISACQNLKSLPHQMRDLKSLRDLTISFCPGVESFPEDGMPPNLISLHIRYCKNLKKPISAFNTLTSLSSLTIRDVFPDAVSFPDEECLLPISLTSLIIAEMESLAYLSLQNLISLQSLDVTTCPNLRSLGSMPATLEKLNINACPILKESLWVVEKKQKQIRIQPPALTDGSCLTEMFHSLDE